jgi:DNA phosphorothioation-dependent restriction protein DptG
MERTYEDALRIIAESYGQAIAVKGGMSLARVATLVVNRGSFFTRLSEDTSFSARNLDRLATWFRNEDHWPDCLIPKDAAEALFSIGRPPLSAAQCGRDTARIACDREAELHRSVAA